MTCGPAAVAIGSRPLQRHITGMVQAVVDRPGARGGRRDDDGSWRLLLVVVEQAAHEVPSGEVDADHRDSSGCLVVARRSSNVTA